MGIEVGQIVAGRYEVRARALAAAGYVDWRAHDRDSEVDVSLWWIDPDLLAAAGAREALESGIKAARGVSHAAVRKVFGGGRDGDGFWVASQLGAVASAGDLVRTAHTLAEALEALHAAGLVHGRLCPTDLVQVAGALKVSGGGLWQGLDADTGARVWGEATRFLAPEVLDRGAATPRSDVYSMAAVLVELASGVSGPNLVDTMDVLAADLPQVADVLQRGLADAPERRYARPAALVERLREVVASGARSTVQHDREPPDDAEESLSGLEGEATIEESSPLFKDPSAMPRSVLFGPNQPTVLGKKVPETRPPAPAPASLVGKSDPGAETVIAPPDARPPPAAVVGKVLEVVSHMPAADPKVAPSTPVMSVVDRPDMQPVLRPIGSSERAKRLSAPPGQLGNYAPPREKREVVTQTEPVNAPKKAMWPWIVIAVSLLAVAAVVSLVLLNRKGSAKPKPQPPPAPSAPPPASTAPEPSPEPVVKPLAPSESSQ